MTSHIESASAAASGFDMAQRTMISELEHATNRIMPSNSLTSTDEQARTTPTMTNRSVVRVVDEPESPTQTPQANFMSKKRAFLVHALSQIETEINKMRHAQKTAHELELNLRNRRVALIEQEMEMHEKRCDYLEVLRKFSGNKESPSSVRGSESPSTLMEESEGGMKRPGMDVSESSPSKKPRMQDPARGRVFLPPTLPPRWMPHIPPQSMGSAVSSAEQASLTLLSEMAMRLLGSSVIRSPAMPPRRPSMPIRRPSIAQSSMPVRQASLSPPSMPTMRRPSIAEQGSALIAYQRLTRSPNGSGK